MKAAWLMALAVLLSSAPAAEKKAVGVCAGGECRVCRDCSRCWYCDPKNPKGGSCSVVRAQNGKDGAARDAKRAKSRR